ncbi:signal peptidase I [Brucepastera parasyntrophica]|uniref:signal peptidase I n=1 Tax=Brucepastera parasyntrophica TaxID=2880008 RepID=UPI00210D08F5|nr:signal peptidase I [Brucepastera parasyntrophica]ULQ59414.1 signal peptidase I [Brucepastera parasyntrophica]
MGFRYFARVRPVNGPLLPHDSFVGEFKLAWGISLPFSNTYLVRWGQPEPGDIIIYPVFNRYVIKRCIATEGMPLVFSTEKGYSVTVGDRILPLTEEQYQRLKHADYVPEGMLFALGDNMSESVDSRDYGFVSIDSITGRVLWK